MKSEMSPVGFASRSRTGRPSGASFMFDFRTIRNSACDPSTVIHITVFISDEMKTAAGASSPPK